jgi:excinuclease UvrABC helicase subunit UvrB
MMMHTRAMVYQAVEAERFDTALTLLERGVAELLEWQAGHDHPEEESATAELEVLEALRREVLEGMPPDAVPRLQWELNDALAREDFERAAGLRDKLSALRRDERAV